MQRKILIANNPPAAARRRIDNAIRLQKNAAGMTAQRNIERQLARVSSQIRAIMDNVNGGVSAHTFVSGKIEYIFKNDRYCSIFGYTKEQFDNELPQGILDLVCPEDRPVLLQAMEENERTGKPARIEFRARRRDGSRIWLRRNSSTCRFNDVATAVHVSVTTDVTKEKEAEQRLQEYAEQLKMLTESIPGGIAIFSFGPEGLHMDYFNDGFYRFSGYSREEYEALLAGDPLCLLFTEDVPGLYAAFERIKNGDENMSCTYRCHTKDGGYRWFDLMGSIAEREGDRLVVNTVQFDITERKESEEKLRVSEEQFRIAAAIGGRMMTRYDIKTREYAHDDPVLYALGFGPKIENMPQALFDIDGVAPECVEAYEAFYENIRRGEKTCDVEAALRAPDGKYRWMRCEATVIFDADGQPAQAIIVSADITEQREKEAIYIKWQQSIRQKAPDSYTLLRWNLSKNASLTPPEGTLIQAVLAHDSPSFDELMQAYAAQRVFMEDQAEYLAAVNVDTLLANYYRGQRAETTEYREALPEGGMRWLRLTVELVEYPNSPDVQAYLMYEDIDESKKAELLSMEQANTDPLTGTLNRAAFMQKMNRMLAENKSSQHALFMLDVDGFKMINDNFGHIAGDQALIDIAVALRSTLRHGDLLGRLGGDEFLVCLKDIPYDAVIEKKARQICALVRRSFSLEVQISASVGVAVYPRDGTDFDTLYRHADTALYSVKDSGKDSFAFFDHEPDSSASGAIDTSDRNFTGQRSTATKRRMLIVDDDKINRQLLINMFQDEFLIETAPDGRSAMIRLRHFGAGFSIVLLDLLMPGMDGFAVLEEMRSSLEMRSIPVVVVSSTDERKTSLRAIQCGASDFVTKPIDPALVRLRVQSAISRAENERLRAQNSYLLLQSNEEAKYRTVLESTGTVVIEYDWINGVFAYDASISRHLAGDYNGRTLWHILLSDMVADALDIKSIQDLVYRIANDRGNDSGSMLARLKTPEQQLHWFRIGIFKRSNEFHLTDKIILTFNDVNDEVLADEKLRYQAERDGLTGLYNRQTFLKKAEEMVGGRPAGAYLMAVGDVDNFKMVNDRYGHAEGDQLLQYIARTLQADADRVNGLCGRMGSDVFAVLIPNTSAAFQRMSDYSKSLLSGYSLELETTCSVGYYIIEHSNISAEAMLDRATMAKQTVKGKYGAKVAWYDEPMRQKLLLEQEIAGTMEAALNGGLFDIYLQPQFNHISGEICGAEALVRWLHPERGVLFLPGEFIPLFEKNGFITKLDEYVWNRTAELFHEWLLSGREAVPISVNVSRLDTHDPLLCERLLDILKRNDIPIGLFRLEITESLFEEDAKRLAAVIDRLHAAGFVIEMDDFGSGYSSLNILKDVPVDILKLDMRFFSGTENRERSGVILNAVMRMARWLDISVIAEGVETKEQADYLASIGCPVVQGYLYAAPMPVVELDALLRQAVVQPRKKTAAAPEKKWDTKALWAIDSLDSLLFYNYMDAALIYEYYRGAFEALRGNKRFFEIVESNEASLPVDTPFGMHPDDIPLFFAATERAIASGEEESLAVRRVFAGREDCLRLCCTLRALPGDGDRALLLCTVRHAD